MTEWKSQGKLCEEVVNDLQSEGGWKPHSLRERGLGFVVGRISQECAERINRRSTSNVEGMVNWLFWTLYSVSQIVLGMQLTQTAR